MWSSRTEQSGGRNSDASNSGDLSAGRAESSAEGVVRVGNVAVIGKGMVIKGEIKSRENLHIDGEISGTLEMPDCRLSVGREGKLEANVTAREIDLMGVAEGDLEATSKIIVHKGARLIGDLRAPGILIEEGAYVKGKIEIVNKVEMVNSADPAGSVVSQPIARKAAAG